MAKSKYLDLTGLSKFKDKITSLLVSHTSDNNIHTSTEEKEKISTAYSHSTSVHAPTDATKVEKSSTNGNIKINGNETIVYDDNSLSSNVTQNTAELQDIRVKADGTTATSAGNAVREQVGELKKYIGELQKDVMAGSIPDNSITLSKIVTGQVGFVTPELFTGSDTQKIQSAINSGFPVLLTKDYDNIGDLSINKKYVHIVGNGKTVRLSGEITINERYTTLDGIRFLGHSGNKTETALNIKESYGLTINNCTFTEFDTCVYFVNDFFWHTKFDSVEFNHSNVGANLISSIGSIDNIWIGVITIGVDTIANIDSIQLQCVRCNFALNHSKIECGGGCLLEFNSCNFEADKEKLTETCMSINSFGAVFINCKFLMYGDATSSMFRAYSGCEYLTFINCRTFHRDGDEMQDFFNPDSQFLKYGAVSLIGSDSLTTDENINRVNSHFFVSNRNGFVIEHNDAPALDTSKIKRGSMLFNKASKKMEFFDGINIIELQYKSGHTLTISLNAIDGGDIYTTVIIENTTTGEVVETLDYNNEILYVVLPKYFSYRVTIGDADGYAKPNVNVFTGVMNHDMTISATYQFGVIYGYHVNNNESDPASAVTYLEDAIGFTPAKMNYSTDTFEYGSWENAFFIPKPCMLKRDGTVDYYLDANNYALKENGESSDIVNEDYDGNAMMEWGQNGKKIYYKMVNDEDGNGYSVYISDFKVDEYYHCWSFINNQGKLVDHFYTPIYNGSLDSNNCLRSLSGKAYMMSKNAETEISYAKSNNLTSDMLWYTEVYCDIILINSLLVLMGKSLNTQHVYGQGHTTGGSEAVLKEERTGTMNDKGMFYGTNDTTHHVKVFGMENWWGCQWRRFGGLMQKNYKYYYKLTNGTQDGSTATTYGTTTVGMIESEMFTPNSSGYQKKRTVENGVAILPNEVGGSDSTYYCDNYWISSSETYACRDGCSVNGSDCGAFCLALSDDAGRAYWTIGAALSCKPLAR